jgi:site-specific DNA recombinase
MKTLPETKTASSPVSAVIYCRVSSVAQVQKGHGAASQETRCREFARMRGYQVERVFTDEAVSGSLLKRPAMQDMLAFLRARKNSGNWVALCDDLSRIARDVRVYLDLRSAIASTGARLESPNIEFGNGSDSVLVEHLLASVAQHQREKNAEQTQHRMRARMMNGYWPFHSCIGLRHVPKPGEGRVLERDEPCASIIQEAMEGYASGRFRSQAEVARFLECQPAFPKDGRGKVRYQLVNDILTRALYAGYIEYPEWGVSLRKARHEGLVSFETFERIQHRLKQGSYAASRPELHADFPLRGAVACACCSKPLTACWSKSKTGAKHPYYMCFAKGCERKGKAIRRDVIEGQFGELLDAMTPKPGLVTLAHAMFRKAWDQRLEQGRVLKLACEKELAGIDKQIGVLLDRIVESTSDTVVAAYEKRIGELERSKLVIAERQEKTGQPQRPFGEMFELAFGFLASPSKLWRSGKFDLQKLVLRLTFADHLAWCPQTGFRTPKTTLPFKLLGESDMRKCKMADDRKPDAKPLLWIVRDPTLANEMRARLDDPRHERRAEAVDEPPRCCVARAPGAPEEAVIDRRDLEWRRPVL